jgi:anti-sigma-K factor RskA
MTAHPFDQEVFRESAALYAVGALTPEEHRAFAVHLQTCAECADELRSFQPTTEALLRGVPQIDPPFSLRDRVLAGLEPKGIRAVAPVVHPKSAWPFSAAWMSAAALLLVTIGLGSYAIALRQRVSGLEFRLQDTAARLAQSERQVEAATRAATGAQVQLAVLMAPDLDRVDLAGQPRAPRAAGRAFWSRSRGLVFAAASLPALPAGRIYQLWVVTASNQAISAGLVRPDASGSVTTWFDTPVDMPAPAAMAVTIEPDGGVPAPTGDKYLLGLSH